MPTKSNSNLRAVEAPCVQPGTKAEQFAAYIARVITDKRTSQTVKNVLGRIIIDSLSNDSGYQWDTDAEGIKFMLPRLLEHMNESLADGIMHTTMDALDELLPRAVRDELFRGGAR